MMCVCAEAGFVLRSIVPSFITICLYLALFSSQCIPPLFTETECGSKCCIFIKNMACEKYELCSNEKLYITIWIFTTQVIFPVT